MIAMIDSNASSINVTIEDLTLCYFSCGEHMNMEKDAVEEERWEELEHLRKC